MIDFGVTGGNPGLTRNATLVKTNKEAAYKQTPFETEAEDTARRASKDPYLELTKKYRNTDDKPREILTPSSSFITGIQYEPSLGICIIRMGDGEYYYPMQPSEVGDFLTADSLGQHYNRFIKLPR